MYSYVRSKSVYFFFLFFANSFSLTALKAAAATVHVHVCVLIPCREMGQENKRWRKEKNYIPLGLPSFNARMQWQLKHFRPDSSVRSCPRSLLLLCLFSFNLICICAWRRRWKNSSQQGKSGKVATFLRRKASYAETRWAQSYSIEEIKAFYGPAV